MLVALIVAALAGNIFPLTILPEGELFFGSIAVLLVVRIFGTKWGLLAALLSGLHTIVLWHHPFLALLSLSEALVVGMLLSRGRISLLLADLGFWLFFGLPLAWVTYAFVFRIDEQSSLRLLLLLGANGIFNALLASLACRHPLLKISRQNTSFPLWETLVNLVLFCFLIPPVLTMLLNITPLNNGPGPEVETRLSTICRSVQDRLQSLVGGASQMQADLAGNLAKTGVEPSRRLEREIASLVDGYPEFLRLSIMGPRGRTIVSSPSSDQSTNPPAPETNPEPDFFGKIRSTRKPLISWTAWAPPEGGPQIWMGRPIVKGETFLGMVIGVIEMPPLSSFLEGYPLPEGFRLTLLDRGKRVLGSSDNGHPAMKSYSWGRSPALNSLRYLWDPLNGELIRTSPFQVLLPRKIESDPPLPWQLALEMPWARNMKALRKAYIQSLSVMAAPTLLALALVWVGGRRLVRPLRDLAEATRKLPDKIEEGQAIAWPKHAVTEVGTLTQNFKNLAAAFDRQHQENRIAREKSEEALEDILAQREDILAQRNWEVFNSGRKLMDEMSRRKQIEGLLSELEAAESKYRFLVENTMVGVYIVQDEQLSYVNPRFAETFGYTQEELVQKYKILDLVAREDKVFVSGHLRRQSLGEIDHLQYQFRGVRKDGRIIHVEVLNGKGAYNGQTAILGTLMDISERKEAEETIKHMAYHDPLTDLPNRPLFRDHVENALGLAHRNQQIVGLLFLDLDRFKTINDTLGHDAGDQLLKEVSKRLRDCVRETDTVSRFGGDEFNILLSQIRNESDAGLVAHKILRALQWPYTINDQELHVTTSIGIALYPRDGKDVNTLIKNADTALYRAKDLGKNNYQVFAPSMNAQAMERMELENGLRRVLERNELRVYYQPQVSLASGIVVGAEALARWQHPSGDLISPGLFIPLAEEIGLIFSIGEWMLRSACQQAKLWEMEGFPPIRMGVNVSAHQFQGEEFLELLVKVLGELKYNPRWLNVEITENVVMADVKENIAKLRQLHDVGITVAIDDFGVGYSSLSYLKDYPVDQLKMDRSFVRNLPDDLNEANIARHIVEMAHSLDISVIAEGVERKEQLEFLRSLGCDEVQGYLASPPIPAEEFANWRKDEEKRSSLSLPPLPSQTLSLENPDAP